MNPFNIKDVSQYKSTNQATTETALPKIPHPAIDPSVHDQLLRAALAHEAAKQQSATAPVATPDAVVQAAEPQMPPDDTPPNTHRDILIATNFLEPSLCDEYIEYIQKQQEIDLSVFDAETTNQTGQISWEVDKKTRDTQTVDIEPIKEVVFDLMRYAVRDFLNPFYNVKVKDSEMPQILVYHPGGHYRPHIDGEALYNDGSGVLTWRRNVERDISVVIYLNDDYEGGEIVFPKQAISIKPRKGLMVAFPSNHHFLHGVNPVISGTRYAIVNWFSLGQPASV